MVSLHTCVIHTDFTACFGKPMEMISLCATVAGFFLRRVKTDGDVAQLVERRTGTSKQCNTVSLGQSDFRPKSRLWDLVTQVNTTPLQIKAAKIRPDANFKRNRDLESKFFKPSFLSLT